MKVTIKEIAEMAGVHRSTVDKVIHNRSGVSDEVRQRIWRLLKSLDYQPNLAGLALQKQSTTYRLAAVLLEVDALPFIREGIEAGRQELEDFHIEISYYTTKFRDVQGQWEILDQLIAEHVDGIILNPVDTPLIREAIDRAEATGIPVITSNSDIENSKRMCYVGMDGEKASCVAGRLMGLFLNGVGKIAVISGAVAEENNSFYVAIREQGFTRFLKEHYPDIEIVSCIESFENPYITYEKTKEVLTQYPDLNGIYITCGGVSEVGRAVTESGRQRELKLLSYEDYPEIIQLMKQDIIDCTLSSDIRRQGSIPVHLLMEKLLLQREPEQENIFTEMKVLVKESILD